MPQTACWQRIPFVSFFVFNVFSGLWKITFSKHHKTLLFQLFFTAIKFRFDQQKHGQTTLIETLHGLITSIKQDVTLKL